MNAEKINEIIKASGVDTNSISDGYHTFCELYEHRIALFIALCWAQANLVFETGGSVGGEVWRSVKHSDGSQWDGWFIMGIGTQKGDQITYHLPMSKWSDTGFARTLEKAPEWDGHTSADVLERLKDYKP